MTLYAIPAGPDRSFLRRLLRPGFLPALALVLLLLLAGCSGSKDTKEKTAGQGAKNKPLPVTVAVSSRKDMPVEISAIGTVEPLATVGIKSQVDGIVEKVNFKEGDRVEKGDLLFAIDPRPFATRLEQAKAALEKDRAALANARKQAERYRPAADKGYVSEEEADQVETGVATLAAAVLADQAALATAGLDLDNCSIRSPLSGYTGELLADQGNLVKAQGDAPLVTINQVSPVKVRFTLPEQALPELKLCLAASTLEVRATPPGPGGKTVTGLFSFLDNSADPATGTIRLKATFANTDHSLWPGQFVDVRLRLAVRKDATVVPEQAVQTGQQGAYLYVVGKDLTVSLRPVTVDFSLGGESVIGSGLAAGETVVVDGQLRLTPGATVKPMAAAATPLGSGATP